MPPSPRKRRVSQLEHIMLCNGDVMLSHSVMDDDDRHKVTAGSMVTVTVTLTRTGLLVSHMMVT